jgi:hypothetical protein
MGIDVYATWHGQNFSWEERTTEDPSLIWSTRSGHLGYLREGLSRGPFVTPDLLREAFEAEEQQAQTPAEVRRERLPRAMAAVAGQLDTDETHPAVKAFADFVDLCARMESATGEPCMILVSY